MIEYLRYLFLAWRLRVAEAHAVDLGTRLGEDITDYKRMRRDLRRRRDMVSSLRARLPFTPECAPSLRSFK